MTTTIVSTPLNHGLVIAPIGGDFTGLTMVNTGIINSSSL